MSENTNTTTAKFHVGQLVTKVTYGVNNGGGRWEITAAAQIDPNSSDWSYRVRKAGGKGKGGLWHTECQFLAID